MRIYPFVYMIVFTVYIYIYMWLIGWMYWEIFGGDIFQDYLLMSSPRFSVQKVSDTVSEIHGWESHSEMIY